MNKKGFNLVELIISVAILGIVGSGILVVISHIAKGTSTVETRVSLSSNVALLQKVLSNVQICTNGIDKSNPLSIDFAAPTSFDVSFTINGFGLLQKNTENSVINFYIDELYVDSPIFYGLSATNQKIFIGILKISATQRIIENGTVRRGLSYKNRIVGAFSITVANDKTIVDCKTSPRSL